MHQLMENLDGTFDDLQVVLLNQERPEPWEEVKWISSLGLNKDISV